MRNSELLPHPFQDFGACKAVQTQLLYQNNLQESLNLLSKAQKQTLSHISNKHSHQLQPKAQGKPQLLYLEHLPIQLCQGLHSVLRDHVGDESKSFGFLGEAVYGEVDLRDGSCRRQGLVLTHGPAQL